MTKEELIVENNNLKAENQYALDLITDLAITMDKLAEKFNCNDGQLDEHQLDWAFFHKLTRHSKVYCEKKGVVFQ